MRINLKTPLTPASDLVRCSSCLAVVQECDFDFHSEYHDTEELRLVFFQELFDEAFGRIRELRGQ